MKFSTIVESRTPRIMKGRASKKMSINAMNTFLMGSMISPNGVRSLVVTMRIMRNAQITVEAGRLQRYRVEDNALTPLCHKDWYVSILCTCIAI
ncbi:hypothetical protein D3C85_1114540 [compost metagenome]